LRGCPAEFSKKNREGIGTEIDRAKKRAHPNIEELGLENARQPDWS